MTNDITVLGLGNILLGDEGFGVHFVRSFQERYHVPDTVNLIDGGTLGYGLLDIITACSRLIVIDVIKVDDTPGSLYRFNRHDMELHLPEPTSAHEVEFFHVLHQAELIDECPEAVFLCIVPEAYGEMELAMTAVMHRRFAAMEDLLVQELARWGCSPQRRA